MPDWFKRDLTSLALCWRLARADGAVLGFTSHDRDIMVDGLTYRAMPGMMPSAIERRDTLDPDTAELAGVLTSNLVTAADLIAGRWDGAQLRLFAIDWTNPDDEPLFLLRGVLGDIESDGARFSAELRGPAADLEAPVIEETSPECRASLGDRRCRVDLSGRRCLARVVSADGLELVLDDLAGAPDDFAFGLIRWLDGANAGLSGTIASSAGHGVTLRDAPAFETEAGALVELTQGCDKRFATCSTRFGNALNFRGEPHLPGNDLLVRYAQ